MWQNLSQRVTKNKLIFWAISLLRHNVFQEVALFVKMENYTQIENDILETVFRIGLSKSELAVLFTFLRKLNGFHKSKDCISISQFMQFTGLSNRSVIDALKQLKRMNICSLVKKGTSKKHASLWHFNKDIKTWEPMKRRSLVKFPAPTSEVLRKEPVKISSHTKENNTKENIQKKDAYVRFIKFFNQVTRSKFKGSQKVRDKFNARIKEGWTTKEIGLAVKNASLDDYLMGDNPGNRKYLTPEYILRGEKLDEWSGK